MTEPTILEEFIVNFIVFVVPGIAILIAEHRSESRRRQQQRPATNRRGLLR